MLRAGAALVVKWDRNLTGGAEGQKVGGKEGEGKGKKEQERGWAIFEEGFCERGKGNGKLDENVASGECLIFMCASFLSWE